MSAESKLRWQDILAGIEDVDCELNRAVHIEEHPDDTLLARTSKVILKTREKLANSLIDLKSTCLVNQR